MQIFELTFFFMLVFFVVIALQVERNRRSTLMISFKDKQYWLLCTRLPPNQKVHMMAYFDKPGFNFGPYVWVDIETDEKGDIVVLVEDLEAF